MTRLVEAFFHLLKIAMVAALALMVILVFGNVVLRYGFNLGITVSEELSRMLFVWLTFASAVVGMREHGHLGMDTLVNKLPPAGKKVCLVLSQALMLYATWLFLDGSWQQTQISIKVNATAPVTGMSMGWFYGTGVFFSVCVGLVLMGDLYRVLAGQLRDDELVMVKESEDLVEVKELRNELDRAGRSATDSADLRPEKNK
jgi:TRAP-type transport system small permease protein